MTKIADVKNCLTAVVVGLAATGALAASHANRPNILYIITDQQFAGAMSCAGNKDVHTPAMDSLAANGVRFEKAYCAQPLCVPSRMSMMTGRMPHETKVTTNTHKRGMRLPMLGKILSDAGYDCAYFGKWHLTVPPNAKKEHGFATVKCRVSASPRTSKDKDVPPACVEFLGRKRERPFFVVASFLNPHDICQFARGDRLPNGPVRDLPPAEHCPQLPDNFQIPPREPEILRALQKQAPRVYPTITWKPEKWRQYRWAYYRLIEMVDRQIRILLDGLRKSGQEENTVIIFLSDHGDGHGAHRWNQKQVLYEEVVRVPFIVSFKGKTAAGYVDRKHLVSTGVDLLPTVCDYAGIGPPGGLGGRSVRGLAEGRKPTAWRDFVVSETTFSTSGKSLGVTGRMLRTERYKYIVYSQGKRREQLFDMDRDPGEMVNLAGVPGNETILADHRGRLAAWCRETGDPFAANVGGNRRQGGQRSESRP